MPEQDTITPVAEVQATPEPTEAQTIGDVLDTMPQTPAERPVNTIPENIFLSEKKARKEAEREVKELKAQIQNGATKREVSESISAIAKEFDIDPDFLDKFAATIRSESKREIEDELSSKFKPLEEKQKQEKIDKAFDVHYTQAINAMPEFASIVNAGVIKSLSLLPQNSNKTFPQLIEETYGNALAGKRTIQPTTTSGGKDPAPLDYHKANKDPAYFNEIMANPKLKAEYNDRMIRDGSL